VHDRDERGFTIVELMIVVAIIAVLAAVVVPSFIKESSRSKAKSEIHAMFAELSTREDQYKVEKNTYLDAAACPPSMNAQGTDMTTATCAITADSDWDKLRVTPSESKLTCSYTIESGDSSEDPVPLTEAWVQASKPTLKTPAVSWYFIHAICPNTEYFQASWDSTIRSKDGK
jgi:prepilin-type N-terminal cleavage/methylation domain-containing protein